jgi:hypothetical protein
MEYPDGTTLQDRIRGALPTETIVALAIEIADALHAAHAGVYEAAEAVCDAF